MKGRKDMKPVKANRGIIKLILLSGITCGIYAIYFLWALIKDVNEICAEDGKKTPGLIRLWLLSFITCGIYSFIWWFKLCDRLHDNGTKRGLDVGVTGTSFLLWFLLGSLLCGLGPLIALHKVCKAVNILATAHNVKALNQN